MNEVALRSGWSRGKGSRSEARVLVEAVRPKRHLFTGCASSRFSSSGCRSQLGWVLRLSVAKDLADVTDAYLLAE